MDSFNDLNEKNKETIMGLIQAYNGDMSQYL